MSSEVVALTHTRRQTNEQAKGVREKQLVKASHVLCQCDGASACVSPVTESAARLAGTALKRGGGEGREQIDDLVHVALVGDDDLLLALGELARLEGRFRLGKARELAFEIDDLVIDRQSVIAQEQFCLCL